MIRLRASHTHHDTLRHRDTEAKNRSAFLGASPPRCVVILWLSLALSTVAEAQNLSIRGFGDLGATSFTASDSFEAVLGSRAGVLFGGGIEVVLPATVFVHARVARFQKDGARVFVFDGETFPLGIATTVRITPVELTGGYRFRSRGSRLVPYVGGGVGWHRYTETSDFAEDDENISTTRTGYHMVGGAELRVTRWLGVAGEVQWTTVPDALGQHPDSVSAAFEETDLGGTTFRVKFVVGR